MTESNFCKLIRILIYLQSSINNGANKHRQSSIDYLCENWYHLDDMTIAVYMTWFGRNVPVQAHSFN